MTARRSAGDGSAQHVPLLLVLSVLILGVALLLAGCSAGSGGGPRARPPGVAGSASTPAPPYDHYVALGDSYTAAPYVPTTALAQGCLRSDGNYPSLLADRLDVATFEDVSCSGASTRHLYQPQVTFPGSQVPSQLSAVSRRTDLVTLGIGGNDFGVFATLLHSCTGPLDADPDGYACTHALGDGDTGMREVIAQTGERVRRAIVAVHEAAPDARVVLVGYARIAPTEGICPRRLPLTATGYRVADQVARLLRDAMRTAAEEGGAAFVDMYRASAGHSVCSEHPWVNGRPTDPDAALAYHPFAVEMDAVADRVVRLLRDGDE